MSHLKWGNYTVRSGGHDIEAAKAVVEFYVTREDLVNAAVMAIDEVVIDWKANSGEIKFASARLNRVAIERKLREMLQSYGTIFTEFGADGKTIAFGEVYTWMCEEAEVAVARLYPHLDR